jgi:MshEN domain
VRLGAWLLSKGKITEDQLQRALQHQEFFGGRIGTSLIKLGYVDEDTLGEYLADVSGAPYASPARLDSLTAEVLALVPARLAAQYRVIPIGAEGRRLRLAMRDPKDLIALDEIAFLTGMSIEPSVATEFRIQQALERYYQVASSPVVQVTGASPVPRSATPAEATVAAPAKPPNRHEVGLDGLPLDADPDTPGSLVADAIRGLPREVGPSDDAAPPTSLQQWRIAQREIPDEIPETPGPPSRTVYATGPAAVATLAAPAALAEAAPSPSAIVEAAPETSLEASSRRLQRAETRDEIFEVLLDFASAHFRRSALFVAHSDRVSGWGGRGPGIDSTRVRQVQVALDRPSLFSLVRSGADHYYGPVNDQPANTRLFLDLGFPAPERALLVPLLIKERPTVVLYADNAADLATAPDIQTLRRLLAKASLALEILILKNKIVSR